MHINAHEDWVVPPQYTTLRSEVTSKEKWPRLYITTFFSGSAGWQYLPQCIGHSKLSAFLCNSLWHFGEAVSLPPTLALPFQERTLKAACFESQTPQLSITSDHTTHSLIQTSVQSGFVRETYSNMLYNSHSYSGYCFYNHPDLLMLWMKIMDSFRWALSV